MAFARTYANRIDDLKTDKEVADFIVSLDSARFHGKYSPKFYVAPTDSLWRKHPKAAEAQIKNWEKVDLNGDGLTDIVVLANWYDMTPFVALSVGEDQFKLIRLQYSVGGEELAKVIQLKNKPMLLFYASKQLINRKGKSLAEYYQDTTTIDTLIYRSDAFVEYNSHPIVKKISAVTFTTSTCFGTCPEFKLTIDNKGLANYTGDSFAKPEGKHRLKISATDLIPLYNALAYIDFKKVKDNYAVHWTDYPTATLSIKFADGSVKNVKDYGERGTWGLRAVYAAFFKLYNTQPWAEN